MIQGSAERAGVPISIDTMKARVAEEALQAGALVVNDVSGCWRILAWKLSVRSQTAA